MISEYFEQGKRQVLFDIVRQGNDLRGVGETTGRRKKLSQFFMFASLARMFSISLFFLFPLLSRSIV